MMGWIANILAISGLISIGYKKRIGFLLTAICNAIWAYIGYKNKMPDLLSINIIMAMINTWFLFRWSKRG